MHISLFRSEPCSGFSAHMMIKWGYVNNQTDTVTCKALIAQAPVPPVFTFSLAPSAPATDLLAVPPTLSAHSTQALGMVCISVLLVCPRIPMAVSLFL